MTGSRLQLAVAIATLAITLAVRPAGAKTSIDAVQFDNIALDASLGCTRTFFKSSRNFDGTIYVMPKVIPQQMGDDEHEVFDIESEDNGHLTLSLGLTFPSTEEQIQDTWTSDLEDTRCNFDLVKEVLNRGVTDEKRLVKRIASMPLTSVEVLVPGVAKIGSIGRSLETDEEVDILDYDGKSLPIEIQITPEERDGIARRAAHIGGLPVQVRFRFQARSRDGGVSANIDWQQLSVSLKAALGARRLVTKAELSAALVSSVSKASASIRVDGGQSPSFDKIAQQIVAKVLSVVTATQTPTTDKNAQKNGSDNSVDLTLIDASLAIETVQSQGSSTIQYEENSRPEVATAETVVNFQAKPRDPNLREIRVRAGFSNPTLDEPLLAGQTIKITPAYQFLAKFNFDKIRSSYLTETQIEELHLAEKFPDVASEQMTIANKTIGSHLMAVGKWTPLAGFSPIYSPERYLWLRTEKTRTMNSEVKAGPIEPSLEAFAKLPIKVAFSKFGGRNASTLADLVGDHELWSATFDSTGTITLTGKQDLGFVTFLEQFKEGGETLVSGEKDLLTEDVVMDSIVEEQHLFAGGIGARTKRVLQSDPKTIVQSRYVILNVSRPETKGTAAQRSGPIPASRSISAPVLQQGLP